MKYCNTWQEYWEYFDILFLRAFKFLVILLLRVIVKDWIGTFTMLKTSNFVDETWIGVSLVLASSGKKVTFRIDCCKMR